MVTLTRYFQQQQRRGDTEMHVRRLAKDSTVRLVGRKTKVCEQQRDAFEVVVINE